MSDDCTCHRVKNGCLIHPEGNYGRRSDNLRDAIADVLPWGRTMSVERLADAILALPEMRAMLAVVEAARALSSPLTPNLNAALDALEAK